MTIYEILEKTKNGELSLEEGAAQIKKNQFEDLGYAKLDHNRKERSGNAEVVFCQGKPDHYLTTIFERILENNGEVLGTRASKEQYELVRKSIPDISYHEVARILKWEKKKDRVGNIAVCTGGTADIPVAEEAAQTAEFFGSKVERIYDVGVAGIHRLFAHQDKIEAANVLVVAAGMEGALASVVAGLVSAPVIAVPTSVGYGANFGGLSALLSMLNSCSNGVSVVNIDNGYGAGYIANQINQAIESHPPR